MPLVAGVLEILDDFLFDTIDTPVPRERMDREQMFITPLGAFVPHGDGRLKEYLDTNLYMSGQIPAPHKFLVRAIRCAFIGRTILPVSSCYYADTLLRLLINCKPYWTGPAWKCADPVTMVLNADTLKDIGRHKRVDLFRALRRTLGGSPPLVIDSQMQFSVEVTFAGKSWREYALRRDAPERLVVLLDGTLGRAVV